MEAPGTLTASFSTTTCSPRRGGAAVDYLAGVRFRSASAAADGRGWNVELDGLGQTNAAFVVDATGRASSVARNRGVRRRRLDRLVALVAFIDLASEFESIIEAAPSGWWYAAALPAGRAVAAFLLTLT
jgi:flavin-dependent dehydrogenase